MAYLTCFFFKLPTSKKDLYSAFWECSENQFGRLKKTSTKISKNLFFKILPRENPIPDPDCMYNLDFMIFLMNHENHNELLM